MIDPQIAADAFVMQVLLNCIMFNTLFLNNFGRNKLKETFNKRSKTSSRFNQLNSSKYNKNTG